MSKSEGSSKPENTKENGPAKGESGTGNDVADTKSDNGKAQGVSSEKGKFDPSRFRLTQDFVTAVGGKKHILSVAIRRPGKHEWFTVHPDETWRVTTAMLHWREDGGEFYVVAPELWPALAGQLVSVLLVACVNVQGVVFLWPVRLPGEGERANAWHLSGVEALQLALKGGWVRVEANMSAGAYEVHTATGALGDPAWPEEGFSALFEKAVRDRLLDSLDHPVLKRLRGEA